MSDADELDDEPSALIGDKALALYFDAGLTRNQYNRIRSAIKKKLCNVLPSYHKLQEAKKACYPYIFTFGSPSEQPRVMLGRSLKSLSSDFESLFDNDEFKDVTLQVGEEELNAHKLVLCARSKVFAAMLEHDMEESRRRRVDIVQMEYNTLEEMVHYMYSGQLRALPNEEALKLFVAADRYDVAELKASCREIILASVSLSNVCDIAEVADLHNDELLINSVKAFVSKNGKEIVKTEKWKALSSCKPALCVKMFEWSLSE
ncbi:speckle-type POZ protein B-like [Uloborus diversus]|uniref:speckle-type POZ protein B-like n=1 Tax=Uloborus diversus TaxID=327109 RepID=UPI00240A4EEF|nr:speckle-type POZ protein B-like [Uloborus diversus]